MQITRRHLGAVAAALAASSAFASHAKPSGRIWQEAASRFRWGVASRDPRPDSVFLWTRCAPNTLGAPPQLIVEVAEDREFHRVVADAAAPVSEDTDWTCRVLVAGLKPSRIYWYRFIDANGEGSRIGRTLTAPRTDDGRPVSFSFVSCQNANQGAQNAYQRMRFEDDRAAPDRKIEFVMHLGDFFYELVWYPEDRAGGMYYDRRLRDIVRYPHGEKIRDFHIPTTLEDYRAIYKAYLEDPDLQAARAWWPFVCMFDNHEFSWKGWQSQQDFGGTRPAQTRKVMANQAWFEYQPMRVAQPSGRTDKFSAPKVQDAAITHFDDQGLGLQADNLAAIGSLTAYRTQRFGRHIDLILTDNRSYRSQDLGDRPEMDAFDAPAFPDMTPEEAVDILDAGRAWDEGRPPASILFGGKAVPNFRKDEPPQSMLGAVQKAWFLGQLERSTATWKLWGNTVGATDVRADLHNLPEDGGPKWPGAGYGILSDSDWGGFRFERGQILDHVREHGITGFASLAGDRHAFYAGYLAKSLPPRTYQPVGIEFVTGSVSAPGVEEPLDHSMTPAKPWSAIYRQIPASGAPLATLNLTARRGVKASLVLKATGDLAAAKAATNPEVAPNLDLIDFGGHGYVRITATEAALEAELVCIPRPLERAATPDGGPLRYRISYRVSRWTAGEAPKLERTGSVGNLPLGA